MYKTSYVILTLNIYRKMFVGKNIYNNFQRNRFYLWWESRSNYAQNRNCTLNST